MSFLTVPVGPRLVECISLAYLANRPVLLVGGTGIGKSESIIQSAIALGIGSIVRDLSVVDPVELSGLPYRVGKKVLYAQPEFLPTSGKGLLFFDEISRAPEHVRVPCLQLLTARTINDYRLPPGWLPVAAMNPPGSRYGGDKLDAALVARFVVLNVVADETAWCAWARANGVHEKVCAYVEASPKIFEAPESNPRAWKYVSDLVVAFEASKYTKETLALNINGTVGVELGTAFFEMYFDSKIELPPTPAQVLNNYKRHAKKVQTWCAAGNSSVLESLCSQLLLHLQCDATLRSIQNDTRALQNIARLHDDLPAEFREKLERHIPQLIKKGHAA